MKNIKKVMMVMVIGIACLSGSAEAYMYSFTNMLSKPIAVDFCGIARIDCKMFGAHSKQDQDAHVKIERYGKHLVRYQNAGWLHGPQTVEPGQTAEFNFQYGDVGYCIELNSIQISVDDGSFIPVTLQRAPNDYLASVIEKVQNTGDSVKNLGDAVGSSDNPKAQVAGKAVSAIGGFLKPFADLYAVSACKDGRFVVGVDENGKLAVQTSDFGS